MRKKLLYIILFLLFILNINVKAENEATLKNIQVNKKECECVGYNCSIEIDSNKATVTFELNDPDATVDRLSGFTVELLAQGENKHTITVTNDKGEEKIENVYTIVINMREKSSDVSLSSLKVNGEDITIQEESYVYSYTAKYNDETLKIDAVVTDSKAKIIKEDEYKFPLDRSSISIDFDVEAEDGTVKTHRIVVRRGAMPNTLLKSLKIDHGNLIFNQNTFLYYLQVEYNVTDLIIEALAEDNKATINIEKDTLKVGENKITITVSNGSVDSEYILYVTREENLDKSIANLKYIKIDEYPKLDFEENVLDYTLRFDDIPDKLTIKAESLSTDGKVEILYNEKLTDGSKIVIKNTLIEAGISREYSLTIVSNEKEENNKTFIIVSIIGLIITIIVLGIFEIKEHKLVRKRKLTKILEMKKKKNSKKEEVKEDIEII